MSQPAGPAQEPEPRRRQRCPEPECGHIIEWHDDKGWCGPCSKYCGAEILLPADTDAAAVADPEPSASAA